MSDRQTDRDLHGDPKTMKPRLRCTECGDFVYVTWGRYATEGFFHLECECRAISRTGENQPEVWVRAF